MDLFKVIGEDRLPDPNKEPYPGAYNDRLEQLAYEAGLYSPRGKRKDISGLVIEYLIPQVPDWYNP
jgi:hypothetical protein